MLAFAMVFASVWAAGQLLLLGSLTRSLRLPVLFTLVGIGMYAVPALTIPLQFLVTRAMAMSPWWTVASAVDMAAYTIDPVIEEVLKVLPLLVFGLGSWRWARTSRQWGLTDWVIAGGAMGAGFGLLEAMMRLAHRADAALAVPGGWLMPTGLAPPVIPSPLNALTSWLPKPFATELLGFAADPAINEHVAWSAVAGLGVGLVVRNRNPTPWVAPALVVWASGAHAATNWDIIATPTTVGTILTAPFRWTHPLLGAVALAAVAVAVWLDAGELRRLRAAAPDLLLSGEDPGLVGGAATIARRAVVGAPWSAWVAWRFALARRAALRGKDPMLRSEVGSARDQLDRANSAAAWNGVSLRPRAATSPSPVTTPPPPPGVAEPTALPPPPGGTSTIPPPPAGPTTGTTTPDRPAAAAAAASAPATAGSTRSPRATGMLVLWLLVAAGPLWLLGVGTTPALASLVDPLDSTWAARLALLPLAIVAGWTVWQWRGGIPLTSLASESIPEESEGGTPSSGWSANRVTRVVGQMAITSSAVVLSIPVILQGVLGAEATDRMLRNFHLLDALSDMLFVVGIALLLAGFFLFPPAALLTTSLGTMVLVPTITTGFVVTTSLGVTSILLAQAAGNGGSPTGSSQGGPSGGGSGSGGIPQTAPRTKPPARHWKLRNIVDGLWRRHTRPDRIGNGTSMDAFRNEVLTGRPTQGSLHRQKLQDAANGLRNWIRDNPASKGRTLRSDRQTARELLAEIESLLRSAPP